MRLYTSLHATAPASGLLSAVLRVSSGVGAPQQFTSDKRLLGAAVERVRWSPRSRGEANPINSVVEAESAAAADSESATAGPGPDAQKSAPPGDFQSEFSVGDTRSALSYIARGKSRDGRGAATQWVDVEVVK